MSTVPFRANQLHWVDRMGDRDQRWVEAFGLGREALAVAGFHCLACGRRLWSRNGARRVYCNSTCMHRHRNRRARFRAMLRESGEACPYCYARPENGHTMVTENPAQAPTSPDGTGREE